MSGEKFEMMVHVGKEIAERWVNTEWRYHKEHHVIRPGYRQDVTEFPLERLMREICDRKDIPGVWSSFWVPKPRQLALNALGCDLGDHLNDGGFRNLSSETQIDFQRDTGAHQASHWITFASDADYHVLKYKELETETVACTLLSQFHRLKIQCQ